METTVATDTVHVTVEPVTLTETTSITSTLEAFLTHTETVHSKETSLLTTTVTETLPVTIPAVTMTSTEVVCSDKVTSVRIPAITETLPAVTTTELSTLTSTLPAKMIVSTMTNCFCHNDGHRNTFHHFAGRKDHSDYDDHKIFDNCPNQNRNRHPNRHAIGYGPRNRHKVLF